MSFYHEILGLLSFGISLSGSAVYIRSIFRGETRPHVYTHLVWGIITAIAFFAQVSDHAGPGSWATAITAIACLFQSALALKYGEKNITRADKIALGASFAAIAAWVMTDNALAAVILASVINVLAFAPTIRKSWTKPWEENLAAYNIANVKVALSIPAIAHFTPTTALYPATAMAVNLAFVALCLWRRRALAVAGTPAA